MATFTLDDIREAAEAKYGATEIVLDESTTVRLLNPLRLSKENRSALAALQDRLSAEPGEDEDELDVDQENILRDAIRLVAETDGQAERLVEVLGDDLALLAQVFETYIGGTQMGEASASDD